MYYLFQPTLGRGQHPYCPDCILQQVLPDGHVDCPSGQITSCWLLDVDGSLVYHGRDTWPR